MNPRRRLDLHALPESLPEYVTISDIATVMGVQPPTVIRYTHTEARFPKRVNRRGALYRRADVLRWLRTRNKRVASKPTAAVDELGKLTTLRAKDLPTYLDREAIAALLGVKPDTIRSYASLEDFPPKAFGDSVVIYRGSEVLDWLKQRAQGITSLDNNDLADPTHDPLTIDEIASIMGISGSSLRVLRIQRDAEDFPPPLTNPDTGRPHRPAQFDRGATRDYLRSYAARRLNAGLNVTPLCQQVIDEATP